MNVLWLCNLMLPQVAQELNKEKFNSGGWMTGLLNDLLKNEDYHIAVCFPVMREREYISGCVNQLEYYGFPSYLDHKTNLEAMEELFTKILKEFKPDVIHIFGTEYPHTLAMLHAAQKMFLSKRTAVSIQGMVSVYARHYSSGLPFKVIHAFSLRDLLKRANVAQSAREFERRGRYEIESIRECKNIIGRTDWDYACTTQINPIVKYYHCNETLRGCFYQGSWTVRECERYSVFVSQWYNPIKGFHNVLEAVAILKDCFPDIHIFTTGSNPLEKGFGNVLRKSYYVKYIGKLIRKYDLEHHVTFLGTLDENRMRERYLRSNVFVSASSIENSPNSVGEAMLLGVPTISSDVGGVKNMLIHGVEGFVYPFDEPYMLAYYMKRIFQSDDLAAKFSRAAKSHASITHSCERNSKRTCEIYSQICESCEKK